MMMMMLLFSMLLVSVIAHAPVNNETKLKTTVTSVSPGMIIGLSFICMLATIFGACLPFVLNYFVSKKVDFNKSLFTAGSFGFAGGNQL